MKFSAKFEYAMLALLYLKCEPDEAPVSGRVLSEKLDLPYRFLEQILSDLKKAGLVRSARGYQGGYQLSMEPESISVYDIYQATEGKIEPWDCSAASGVEGRCSDHNHNMCVINEFYTDFKSTFIGLMKKYTLQTLCERTQALKRPAASEG
ncbi:MAG: RrF2 family transcriptional regulator [Candidatus Nitrospinota bacterium M3_3B_026]